jgi:hypothetical protein
MANFKAEFIEIRISSYIVAGSVALCLSLVGIAEITADGICNKCFLKTTFCSS